MAEIVLNIEASGEGTLDDDLKAVMGEIGAAIKKSMDDVGADMADALKRHIDNDVYRKSIYNPKEYKRRSESNGLGTPLNEMGDLSPTGTGNATVYNHGGGLTFEYKPTGEHANSRWSSSATQSGSIRNVDGDELIGRIEKKTPSYNWGNNKVPPRPFWQNFVDEMVDDGELERFFVAAMRFHNKDLNIEESSGVIRDANDGNY